MKKVYATIGGGITLTGVLMWIFDISIGAVFEKLIQLLFGN